MRHTPRTPGPRPKPRLATRRRTSSCARRPTTTTKHAVASAATSWTTGSRRRPSSSGCAGRRLATPALPAVESGRGLCTAAAAWRGSAASSRGLRRGARRCNATQSLNAALRSTAHAERQTLMPRRVQTRNRPRIQPASNHGHQNPPTIGASPPVLTRLSAACTCPSRADRTARCRLRPPSPARSSGTTRRPGCP